jgi:hypothetical protein
VENKSTVDHSTVPACTFAMIVFAIGIMGTTVLSVKFSMVSGLESHQPHHAIDNNNAKEVFLIILFGVLFLKFNISSKLK